VSDLTGEFMSFRDEADRALRQTTEQINSEIQKAQQEILEPSKKEDES
jgi:hypothetical protein